MNSSGGFTTPTEYRDPSNYTDYDRPHGAVSTLLVNGQWIACWYDSGRRLWFPTTISVTNPTPASSPGQQWGLPMQNLMGSGLSPTLSAYGFYGASPSNSSMGQVQTGFLPRQNVPPTYVYTARNLLDQDVPQIQAYPIGLAGVSSNTTSREYASIGKILSWSFPTDMGGYNNLDATLRYNPVSFNPTTSLFLEADAVWICRHYIVEPVSLILSHEIKYPLLCASEDSHTVQVTGSDGLTKEHLSRVDMKWSVDLYGNGNYQTFAVVEFKRPGAIDWANWEPAYRGSGFVSGRAIKISQQLAKYAYSHKTAFVCVWDWYTLLLFHFEGNPADWLASSYTPITAKFRLVSDVSQMRINFFIWLKEAVEDFCAKQGVQ
jgi:hypothetical protein